jgi:hypothetical protein
MPSRTAIYGGFVDDAPLMTPPTSAPHQAAVLALIRALSPYLHANAALRLTILPEAIMINDGTVAHADLIVSEVAANDPPQARVDTRSILLLIQVLSFDAPGTDLKPGHWIHQNHSIPEAWFVDLQGCLVERWRPGDLKPQVLRDTIAWEPFALEPGLLIDLQKLFSEVSASNDTMPTVSAPHRKNARPQ